MNTQLVSASQFLVLGRCRFVAAHKSQMSPHSPHGLSHSSSARNIGRGASHESIDLDGFIALASFVGQRDHWDSGQTLNLHHLTGMQLDAT